MQYLARHNCHAAHYAHHDDQAHSHHKTGASTSATSTPRPTPLPRSQQRPCTPSILQKLIRLVKSYKCRHAQNKYRRAIDNTPSDPTISILIGRRYTNTNDETVHDGSSSSSRRINTRPRADFWHVSVKLLVDSSPWFREHVFQGHIGVKKGVVDVPFLRATSQEAFRTVVWWMRHRKIRKELRSDDDATTGRADQNARVRVLGESYVLAERLGMRDMVNDLIDFEIRFWLAWYHEVFVRTKRVVLGCLDFRGMPEQRRRMLVKAVMRDFVLLGTTWSGFWTDQVMGLVGLAGGMLLEEVFDEMERYERPGGSYTVTWEGRCEFHNHVDGSSGWCG